MKQMITEQRRTTDAILALADAIRNQPARAVSSPVGNLGNDFPEKISQPVATPSRMRLAIEYLKAHPETIILTGRELEAQHRPQGVKISYRTWNDAKKNVDSGQVH